MNYHGNLGLYKMPWPPNTPLTSPHFIPNHPSSVFGLEFSCARFGPFVTEKGVELDIVDILLFCWKKQREGVGCLFCFEKFRQARV